MRTLWSPMNLLVAVTTLLVVPRQSAAQTRGPSTGQIKNLVTFGDSFTDVVVTGDGGVAWPTYAAGYGPFNLFPFARAGGTCSNNLTPRPWPSVSESQLPAFFAQRANGSLRLSERETLYTLWIGTNDVGANALLTGGQARGVTVFDTVTCAVNWVRTLYNAGARNFLFQNMIPLQALPMYSRKAYPTKYWTAPKNSTAWNLHITELATAGNAIARLLLQDLAPTLRGAHVGLFDSHALFTDILNRPQNFLNGTAPVNIANAINMCIFKENEPTTNPGTCTTVQGTAADSFLWYDELHPSEQANRIVARQITDAIQRRSNRWTTWFS